MSGCSIGGAEGYSEKNGHNDQLSAYRVRQDFHVPLNADSGWAEDVNESASVLADTPFRLRVEVEHLDERAAPDGAARYLVQVRRNNGDWTALAAENFPQPAKELELTFEQWAHNAQSHWQLVHGDAGSLTRQNLGEQTYLRAEANDQPILAMAVYDVPWQPVEFAAEVRVPKGRTEGGRRSAGIVFDYLDKDNYYRVDLVPGVGLHLVRVQSGTEEQLAAHPFDVPTDEWAELKIIFEGAELTVEYGDGASVFTEQLGEPVEAPRIGLLIAEGATLEVSGIAIEGLPRSPRISIIEADTYRHGDQTDNLLPVSDRKFSGGAGVSFSDETPVLSHANGHSEWEFPLVIRRFSDAAAFNRTGDRFEFRLVDQSGQVLRARETPSVTLIVPEGHLGGTFVETPGRLGPWQAASGDYYFLMEPAETDNMLMAVKSGDGGKTWEEVDGANRPSTGDLEGFASAFSGTDIHMLHQTSDKVFYHLFRTLDHPDSPDTWAIQDEWVASPPEPPTQVADIAVRSDGSVVAVYGGPEKLHFRIRSPDGEWSDETVIDAGRGPDLSGPSIVSDSNDVLHLAYTGSDGTAWYRQLLPDDTLSERQQVSSDLGSDSEDVGSILPLVYLPELGMISLIYRHGNGELWERRISLEGDLGAPVQVTQRAVVQNSVDSDQTGADAVGFGDSVHVLFIEEDTGALFHTYRDHSGAWTEPTLQVGDANVQWVRGNVLESQTGRPIYGYIYDAGSYGGSGMNRFGKIPLAR